MFATIFPQVGLGRGIRMANIHFGDLIHLLKEMALKLGKINSISGSNTYLAALQYSFWWGKRTTNCILEEQGFKECGQAGEIEATF